MKTTTTSSKFLTVLLTMVVTATTPGDLVSAMPSEGIDPVTTDGTFDHASFPFQVPTSTDQRTPCPFLNTAANHGLVNRNGTGVDIFQMAETLEHTFHIDRNQLINGPVQLAIDCGQTYEENGITKVDFDIFFNESVTSQCEERESSSVRHDAYFGFSSSKLVNPELLNGLIALNPGKKVIRWEDMQSWQHDRIIHSRTYNPDTSYREFDLEITAVQGIFLFLMGDDPTLQTVDKNLLFKFLNNEEIPEGFVPGSLRPEPFNFGNPSDEFAHGLLKENELNVEAAMNEVLPAGQHPICNPCASESGEDSLGDTLGIVYLSNGRGNARTCWKALADGLSGELNPELCDKFKLGVSGGGRCGGCVSPGTSNQRRQRGRRTQEQERQQQQYLRHEHDDK